MRCANLERPSRGVASLAIVSALLLLITVAALYLTRNMVTERRAAAVTGNRVAAQEAAESGLAWASQMLNQPVPIDATCQPSTGSTVSFRQAYVQPGGPGTAVAPRTAFPGCKVGASALSCSCPSTATLPAPSTAAGAGGAFSVAFSSVRDATGAVDPNAVRVTATGCSAYSGACNPGTRTSANGPDAVSQASVILKLQPLLRSRPASPLTCAGNCAINNAVRVINRDTNTNGVLINSGGSITGCSADNCLPLQGTPWPETLRANDETLAGIRTQDPSCSASSLFRRYFYQSVSEFASSPGVRTLGSCADGAACAQLLNGAIAQGFRAFVLAPGFILDRALGRQIGSDTDPLILVGQGNVQIMGGLFVNGMVFSNSPSATSISVGNSTVRGAIATCGNASLSGSSTVEYAAQTMSTLLQSPYLFRRVAGSWTDFCSVDSTGQVTCR